MDASNDTAKVSHGLRQASDHSMIILDSNPRRARIGARFIFESSWTTGQESEEMVKEFGKE